ncbi:MAG: hypothetical protein EOP11_04420 [Proteobacteria bacterium]|nr:MAG: hypothetical protein EOP11_04420 [Pseudomonadota bacterium]
MKSTALRTSRLLASALAITLLFTGCLGTEVKSLGKKSVTVGNGGTGDVESFSITLAYRAGTSRLVTMQGVRDLASAKLSLNCGTNGRACQCLFYKSTSDLNPVPSTDEGLSDGVNSYSCSITGGVDPSQYKYVRLRTIAGTPSTGFINIKTSLSITDVLGELSKDKVRGVYRYSCNRYFFEGEGVFVDAKGDSNNPCLANQRLGIITAPYNYYLYDSKTATNEQPVSIMAEKYTGSVTSVCNRQLAEIACPTSATLRYGLFGERAGAFQVGIGLTTKPKPTNESDSKELTAQTMGFAALPDSAGNCPTGLIKIQPYLAQPQSIIAKGLPGGTNPPSTFINRGGITGGVLDEKVVEETTPQPLLVSRQPNAVPCNGTSTDPANPTGNCANAVFGNVSVVQTVTFSPISPVLCAIPPTLLGGVIP